MEAQVWTLIGLLAGTLIGTLYYLGNRIDALGNRMDARMDGLSGRMDGLAQRMDALTLTVHEQGRQLGSQIYDLAKGLDDHIRRHAS